LPERVGDDEDVTRFLTSRGEFNASAVKPRAFMPSVATSNTSVFRIEDEPARIRDCFASVERAERTLKAAAVVEAAAVRSASLEIVAAEPPDAHANIEDWPSKPREPDTEKAQRLEIALQLAAAAELIRL